MPPCNICLDPMNNDCRGTCDCENCAARPSCPKFLNPTIRITLKCTQSCSHCCFASSPKQDRMMSVDTARTVARFLSANHIEASQIMGGEFFMNPDWEEIIRIIAAEQSVICVVSNGDWAEAPAVKDGILRLHAEFPDLYWRISDDEWHTNRHIDAACAFLDENGIEYSRATKDQVTLDSVVPMGRGDLHFGFYSMLGCYCRNPANKYSFLIDEVGEIYKCGFGAWNYANAEDFLEGGFDERFVEFNKTFYGIFIPSCQSCSRSWVMARHQRSAMK